MKKHSYSILLFLVCFAFYSVTATSKIVELQGKDAFANESPAETSSFDDASFFDPEFVPEEFPTTPLITRGMSSSEILDILTTPPVNLQTILQHNLYKYTNPVNVRPLLDLPIHQRSFYLIECCEEPCCSCFSFVPFYDESRHQFYTKNSWELCSYLAFADVDYQEAFNALIALGKGINVARTTGLFECIKVEERRVGAVLYWNRDHGRFGVKLQVPLYYLEHNFYLDHQEQAAIAADPLFQQEQAQKGQSDSVRKFLMEHLVSDVFGFGDSRFTFSWVLGERHQTTVTVAGYLNLPSAIWFKQGLIGTKHSRCPSQPIVDINSLTNQYLDGNNNDALLNTALSLGTGTLDRLGRIVGDTKLGSNRVTIGAFLWTDYATDCYWIHQQFRFAVDCPYQTTRFFREVKRASDYNRDWDNPVNANANLWFLSTRLVNTLNPIARDTRIDKQFSAQYTLAAATCGRPANLEGWIDFWYQSAEHLSVCAPEANDIPLDLLRAQRSSAMQLRLGGRCLWQRESIHHACMWQVGILGDATIFNRGIGADWSLGLLCGIQW